MMELTVAIIVMLGFLGWFVFKKDTWKIPAKKFPKQWRIVLFEEVDFYNHLSEDQKKLFEFKIQEFLLNCKIIGVSTDLEDKDRVLIAASAVIPIFAFPEWRYTNLRQVLVYADSFNENFKVSKSDGPILGMVGEGNMSGMMILSKSAIHQAFANERDRLNTPIHEFIHVIDLADGVADGIPSRLMERQYAIPWIDLMHKEIEHIKEKDSDVRQYGATNRAEFFSVISEYFFESPHLLQSKHPDIYNILEQTFNQKLALWQRCLKKHEIRRNDLCPCGSGKKFKKCCGR